MSDKVVVAAKSPSECTEPELMAFAELVRSGGEVANKGLLNRIKAAQRLIFLRQGECLAGVAALKRPRADYRTSIFDKAHASQTSGPFASELGWVFVVPNCRGKRFSHVLTGLAVATATGECIFATSRTDNYAMHTALHTIGFDRHGTDFPSRRGLHCLALFLRQKESKVNKDFLTRKLSERANGLEPC